MGVLDSFQRRELATDGGFIRLHHHKPPHAQGRPVVFAPGFSAPVEVWEEAFEPLAGRVELVVVETLEKGTTRYEGGPLHPSALARQLGQALEGLEQPVLLAASWLGTSLLQGAADGSLRASTMVAFDPLPVFWLPVFLPRWSLPLLPATLFGALRRPLTALALAAMQDGKQKARFKAIVDSADPLRWKRAALDALDVDLLDGRLRAVDQELWVVNGADDPVHPAADLARIVDELPKGRLKRIDVHETVRERFAGQVALAFARVPPGVEPDWPDPGAL